MPLLQTLRNLRIVLHSDNLTVLLNKIIQSLRIRTTRNYHSDFIRKSPGQPESDILKFSAKKVIEKIDTLQNDNNFIVLNLLIIKNLLLHFLLAHRKPIRKVLSQFFFQNIYFLIYI